MSFGSGATLNVGTLAATFKLDASGATSVMQTINQQAQQVRNSFGNVVFKLDASQSQAAIQQLTQATVAFKAAQTQAVDALTQQRAALTQTKAALDQQRTATESARTANQQYVQSLTQQKTATEAARTATAQARTELAQLQLEAKKAETSVSGLSSAWGKIKSGLGTGIGIGIGSVLGFEALNGVEGLLKGIGSAAIGMNANLQQSQTAFTALTGSAQTATTLVNQLTTLASHSTFGLAQLQGAAQQMIAFGVATANVPPLLQSVQNAAAASGGDINDKFQRISYVISELSSGMQLSERQLRQLAQAGVPLTAIAQQLGITVEQLQNAGKTGEVTSAQVVAAFQKVYTSGNLGDFMSKQAQTFSGAMNLIRTNLSLAVAQGFQPLFQSISNVAVKIGQFVQTATFQQWVAGLRAAVTEAVAVLKSFMAVLGPIGDAIAKVFGLNTANISAEMAAVKNATVDVGQYNAALQAGGGAADDTKAQLAEYKKTVDQASLALVGLNDQLAQNKIALDANARSIQAVKNQYDPIIKNATQQIRDINILTPDELSRKQRELELDRDRARLELTRPDTSSFDTRILSDQTTLANLPRLDTSKWDDAIAAYDARIKAKQDEDPAAGLRGEIQALQDEIGGLNTDNLDRQINHIRDLLSTPAPDTHGISNQLIALQEQLAGGQISQADFASQYGALSVKKEGIEQGYNTQKSGLEGQLKLLEAQRTTQAETNAETRQADENRIRDLNRQVAISTKRHAAEIKGLEAERKEQERQRSDAEKADAKRRRDLEDDIRTETNLRTQALAPYDAALKKITDEQEQNRLKDAAAAAQRAIDIAPWQAALDKAKETEDAALAPLNEQKQALDDVRTKLGEQRTEQENIKSAAEANARALKDGADAAGKMADNLARIPKDAPIFASSNLSGVNTFDEFGRPYATEEDSPLVKELKKIQKYLDDNKDSLRQKVAGVFNGFVQAVKDAALALKSTVQLFYDVSQGNWGDALQDLKDLGAAMRGGGKDAGPTAGAPATRGMWGNPTGSMRNPPRITLPDGTNLTADGPAIPVIAANAVAPLAAGNALQTALGGFGKGFQVVIDAAKEWVKQIAPGGDVQKAQESYGAETAQVFAPGSPAQDAIAKYGGVFVKWLGDGGDMQRAILSYVQQQENQLGSDNSPASQSLAAFGQSARGVFGDNGLVHTLLTTNVPGFLTSFVGTLKTTFDPGGTAQTPVSGYSTALTGVFGPNGTISTLLGTDVPTVLSGLVKALGGHFDEGGTARGPFSGFATFVQDLFKSGGTLDGYVSALAPLMDTAMKGNLQPLQGFLNSIAAAVDVVGKQFSIPGFADFKAPDLMSFFGGGASGGGGHPVGSGGGGFGAAPSDVGGAAQMSVGDVQKLIAPFSLPGDWNDLAKLLFDDSQSGIAALFGQYAPTASDTSGALAGAFAAMPDDGTGWPMVAQAALAQIGSTSWGSGFNTLCEGFSEQMERNAGFGEGYWDSAATHAYSTGHNRTFPGPVGSLMHWGTGYFPFGHAGISMGDGSIVSTTTGGTIQRYSMAGKTDYVGWIPPGLATGGVTYGGNPQMVVVGDGPSGEREFHFPEPELRDVIRSEGAGMTFGDINIHLGASADPYTDGKQAGRGFLDAMAAKGYTLR